MLYFELKAGEASKQSCEEEEDTKFHSADVQKPKLNLDHRCC